MEENEQAAEQSAFSGAIAAFKEQEPPDEPVGAPNAEVEGEEPKAPEPEAAAPDAEQETEVISKSADPEIKKPSEFVEFDKPEQKKRFNDVFGYAKKLERELEAVRRQQIAQPVATPQPAAPVAPQPQVAEPKPKLSNFETTDQWEEAVFNWIERSQSNLKQEILQQQTQQQTYRQQQEEQTRINNYVTAKTNDGYQKFGQMAFDTVCADVVNFAPWGSVMHQTLFGLNHYPDVMMELGKNLQEADRISRLSAHDQIYELKSLEKKLIAREELAKKAQPKTPTKVEAPGQGEDMKTAPSSVKVRQAAKASGSLRDWGKVFQSDQSL